MTLNFPNNPTINQVYTADQKSWRRNVISSEFDLSTAPSFTTLAVESGFPLIFSNYDVNRIFILT
jgi:hypothetical protein